MKTQLLRGVSGLTLALVLAACGQPVGSMNTADGMATATGAMEGMNHGATSTSAMEGMDHGATATTADVPYDAQFIDGMIMHHKGAVMMAEQALEQSERPEIRELAQNIIATQNEEISQMTAWRDEWYPGLAPSAGTGMEMGDMELSADVSIPFDQRFIDGMISHHQGAIDMARDAQSKSEHSEIKALATAIITAQEGEIARMQQWKKEWFQ